MADQDMDEGKAYKISFLDVTVHVANVVKVMKCCIKDKTRKLFFFIQNEEQYVGYFEIGSA